MSENFIIYKITNLLNGKIYIGKTKNFERRMGEHFRSKDDTLLQRNIKKYGKESFKTEIIDMSAQTEEDLSRLESNYIKLFNSLHPNGYNLCVENEGIVTVTDENLKIRRNSQKNINKFGVVGVSYDKRNTNKKYKCNFFFRNKRFCRSFATLEEAGEVHDKMVIYHFGFDMNLNYPEKIELYKLENLSLFSETFIGKPKNNKKSNYIGVLWDKHRNQWKVHFKVKMKSVSGGFFNDEMAAAIARDILCDYFNYKVTKNFPEKVYSDQQIAETVKNMPPIRFKGILFKGDKWQAKVKMNGKTVVIGYFETKEGARKAQQDYIKEKTPPVSLPKGYDFQI